MGAMEPNETIQITSEALCLMDLQVEVLRGPLSELTTSQLHDYEERRDRIGELCSHLCSSQT